MQRVVFSSLVANEFINAVTAFTTPKQDINTITIIKMNLQEAIGVLKDAKYIGSDEYASDYDRRMKEAIDTVVKEVCDHHFLPIGEWDGVMMLQCTKCNLYKEGEGKKTCVHPYAMVYGGCGKPERCLLCGEILSD